MLLLRNRDFLAGLLFLLLGAAFLWIARDYDLGTARRMGPGYFPKALSIVLIGIGAAVLVRAFLSREGEEALTGFAWRGLLFVVLGTVLFGITIRGAGIVIAVAALVVVSALGYPHSRPLPVLALASGLALFCYALFVQALGLPLALLGTWFQS